MKRIITIQHTRSLQHENGMIGSVADWPLTETGRIQAECIAEQLKPELYGIDFRLYTSDLLRARQTAEPLAHVLGLTPHYTAALREFDLGEAVGYSKNAATGKRICPVWPGTLDWANTADDAPFHGAESRKNVWNRLKTFLTETDSVENLLIVSHSGTLSILFALWLGITPEMTNHCLLTGKPGGVSELQEDDAGHRILVRLNDMTYIKK